LVCAKFATASRLEWGSPLLRPGMVCAVLLHVRLEVLMGRPPTATRAEGTITSPRHTRHTMGPEMLLGVYVGVR
jgi:hypothetical protein